jgi:hypothetical protein
MQFHAVSHCDLSLNMPSRTSYHGVWSTKKVWVFGLRGIGGFVVARSCMT